MAPTGEVSSSSQQWLPLSGFLGRAACCAVPSESITDMIVMEDKGDRIVEENLRPRSRQPLAYRSFHELPSPTLSPARRDLERWKPPPEACYAESAVTASTLPSDDELFEEIASNATTEVASHRHRQLLASTLASAGKQMKLAHEER